TPAPSATSRPASGPASLSAASC
ncbi:hypothetical protein BN1708_019138, partial [Verticillium longisporum]